MSTCQIHEKRGLFILPIYLISSVLKFHKLFLVVKNILRFVRYAFPFLFSINKLVYSVKSFSLGNNCSRKSTPCELGLVYKIYSI